MANLRPYAVSAVYIIPSDAEPWRAAQRRATETLQDLQWFFADEMEFLGYEPKTFEIDYDNNRLVTFEVIRTELTRRDFGIGRKQVIPKAMKLLPTLREEYRQVCFIESYSYVSGVLSGVIAGTTERRSYLSSLYLKVGLPAWLGRTEGYGGEIFPWISSEPMIQNTLSWKGRGLELGDVSGAAFGTIAHELEHCFGPDHHAGNDERERMGHLMGSGDIKFRGVFRPDLTKYTCVLSKRDAEELNQSPFFGVRTDLKPKGCHWLF
jgi:hypothetical protein